MTAKPGPLRFIIVFAITLIGPFTWALHFAAVYGVQHMACSVMGKNAEAVVQTFVCVASVIGLMILAVPLLAPQLPERVFSWSNVQSETSHFLLSVMRLLTLLSLLGVVWAGLTVFFLPECVSLY